MNANLPIERMAPGGREEPSWRVSTDTSRDPAWDAFLADHPVGHFQQTSLWALVKAAEGWRSIRAVAEVEGHPVGGFQILYMPTLAGRIGYVSKGPVLLPERRDLAHGVLQGLRDSVQAHRIRALIVQPPDVCAVFPGELVSPPFLPNRLVGVIEANCEVAVGGGFDAVERRMRPHTRQEVRQAAKRGVVIRKGGEEDLETFFRLMTASCARQGQSKPNPRRVELLTAMWRHLHPHGHLRLDMAEVQSEPVAGLLSIAFGSRVTFWKKGWSGAHAHAHPNQAMQYEALRWAATHGFQTCDFAAMSTDLAHRLIEERPVLDRQKKSRDFFNLGFGGAPVLLPEARVMVPNLFLRSAYRVRLGLGRDHTGL